MCSASSGVGTDNGQKRERAGFRELEPPLSLRWWPAQYTTMIFQVLWSILSLVFYLNGSQRGLLSMGLSSFGLGMKSGLVGTAATLLSYFIVPSVR